MFLALSAGDSLPGVGSSRAPSPLACSCGAHPRRCCEQQLLLGQAGVHGGPARASPSVHGWSSCVLAASQGLQRRALPRRRCCPRLHAGCCLHRHEEQVREEQGAVPVSLARRLRGARCGAGRNDYVWSRAQRRREPRQRTRRAVSGARSGPACRRAGSDGREQVVVSARRAGRGLARGQLEATMTPV